MWRRFEVAEEVDEKVVWVILGGMRLVGILAGLLPFGRLRISV